MTGWEFLGFVVAIGLPLVVGLIALLWPEPSDRDDNGTD